MKRIVNIGFAIVLACLVGCNNSPMSGPGLNDTGNVVLNTTTLTAVLTDTDLPEVSPSVSLNTPTPSQTITASPSTPATGTPTISPSPTFLPETILKVACLNVVSKPIEQLNSNGIVIFEDKVIEDGRYRGDDFMLNMKSGEILNMFSLRERNINYSVSQDRTLVAFERVLFDPEDDIIQDDLIIANADRENLVIVPWEESWGVIAGWLEDQRIVIDIAKSDPEEASARKPFSLLVLNPFTVSRQVLKPDYPDIYSIPAVPNWNGWSLTMYDPTLSRLVYAKSTGRGEESVYAIWDIVEQHLVASLDNLVVPAAFTIPRWSPDGSRFVTGGNGKEKDLVLVNRNGQIEPLTSLGDYANILGSIYSWSPDGKYIVMYYYENDEHADDEVVKVAIINTKTRQVVDTCLEIRIGGEGYGFGWGMAPPIWSPDGTQFLVVDWYEADRRRVFLVDIEQNTTALVAEDAEPAGWMISP